MKRNTAARLIGMLILAAACGPAVEAEVPAGEVHVVFHGLIAFVPDESGMYAVHVSPHESAHLATMAIELSRLASSNTLTPDYVLSGSGGDAIGVWLLHRGFELTADNIAAPAEPTDFSTVSGTPKAGDKRIRWVPHMDDIFDGKPQALDLAELSNAAAIGRFPLGQLLPIFDKPEHEKDNTWEIHKRDKLAIADGVKLKLNLTLDAMPVIFEVERDGVSKQLKVKSRSEVRIASFPLTVPISDFEHFHHFYHLRADKSTVGSLLKPVTPSPTPMRCAPVVFCCK